MSHARIRLVMALGAATIVLPLLLLLFSVKLDVDFARDHRIPRELPDSSVSCGSVLFSDEPDRRTFINSAAVAAFEAGCGNRRAQRTGQALGVAVLLGAGTAAAATLKKSSGSDRGERPT